MVRPDSATLRLVAYKKIYGAPRWEDCEESHPIPLGIMLPGYSSPNRIILPAVAVHGAAALVTAGASVDGGNNMDHCA